jgi:hypothetical protein
MPRLSAIDAMGPAFERSKIMLFRPFRLKTWLKLGFIGWLGGGLVTASANFNYGKPTVPQFPHDQFPNDPWAEISRAMNSIHLASYLHAHLHIIWAVLAVVVAISLIFLYLFCRFRFILFDVVVSGQSVIGRGWRRYSSHANRYFGFWFVYTLVNWAAMALIIGMPIWHAYKSGAFSGDNSLLAFLELIGTIALGVIAASIVFGIISTLAKDFILPLMALDDLALGDAWSQLWRVLASEPGAWAGYFGMKLLLAIGAGIGFALAFLVAMLALMLVLAIPAGLLILLGVIVMKAAGVIAGIVVFVITALLVVAAFFCLVMVLTAPISVFFAAYAFYFFGGRYPKLEALLWPQPTPPTLPPQVPATAL